MTNDNAVPEPDPTEVLATEYATMIRQRWQAMGQPLDSLGGALIFESMNILFGLGMSRQALGAAMREMAELIEDGGDPREVLTKH